MLQLLIPLVTWSIVNVNDVRLISLNTSRVSQEEVCLTSFDAVNSNVMASFSALGGDFPSIVLIVLQSLVGSDLWSSVSTTCLHMVVSNVHSLF